MFGFWFFDQGVSLGSITARLAASAMMVIWFLPMHEIVHIWVANSLLGNKFRLKSVNLQDFFDPIGSICMLLFGYGWAKPSHASSLVGSRREKVLVAIAGPIFNFVSAILSGIVYNSFLSLSMIIPPFVKWLLQFWIYLLRFNVTVSVINFLPVPPFDGFQILEAFVPKKFLSKFYKNYNIISLVLVFLVVFGFFDFPLRVLENALQSSVMLVSGLPFLFFGKILL
ncbi:MAG: site-2 protease family protein [Oscillospiraceae bacterium]|jgi:Zn-dependent protease|nr:site-2 protease family protein [Oscillospiraceae bacterium]